ncbi:MAG: DUF3857 domain-containing protein [Bacteroidetes bacterium]|nr:DUF3857 domain-containing protein [Bacteroidota bacterium]
MRILLFLTLFPSLVLAQFESGFKFGAITYADLGMKEYSKDSTAVALVLNEFGDTYIQNASPYNLILEYHVKIKILKRQAFELANFEIPLRIIESEKESITDIQASTFNLENNSIKESKLNPKDVFTENRNKSWDFKKFALPDVRIGSIIEIKYFLESPFIFNWRTWEFQSDIPKVNSDFRAKIPGNYTYNIVLRGPLTLSKNKSDIVNNCLTIGGGNADCIFVTYGMNDIPAFKEEDYMTAKRNFLSALNFELIEIKRFDGAVTKYTEEWSDVDRKLQSHENFGSQIKQARKLWDDQIQLLTKDTSDPLVKAKSIFNEIKKYYQWNDAYGNFTDLGARKAYQSKKGNVADLNLTLVGALQSAGLQAEPAMLSTRQNGLPTTLHPVLSGFNYVIARVTIGTDQYWLDATHPLHPFGFVPERCLNGKVRVVSKISEWVDLKIKDKDKRISELTLTVDKNGDLKGNLKITHFGYDAFDQRKKYFSFESVEEYRKEQTKTWNNFEVTNYSSRAVDSLDKPFVEEFELLFAEKADNDLLYFSPFLVDRWEKNPFRSAERNYPVDFGAPLEQIMMLKLDYKNLFSVDELPKSSSVFLPQSGGRYFFSVSNLNNEIQMTSNLTLNKSVYSSDEYHYLKEFFARVIQCQQSQFVFKKNK